MDAQELQKLKEALEMLRRGASADMKVFPITSYDTLKAHIDGLAERAVSPAESVQSIGAHFEDTFGSVTSAYFVPGHTREVIKQFIAKAREAAEADLVQWREEYDHWMARALEAESKLAARQAPDLSREETIALIVRDVAELECDGSEIDKMEVTPIDLTAILENRLAQPLPAAMKLSAAFGGKAAQETVREFGQRMYEQGKADALQQEGGKETPAGDWPKDFRDVIKGAEGVAHQKGRAAAVEEAIRACEAIAQDHRDQYKGRGKYTSDNPRRADPHADGCFDGANECADAIRAISSQPSDNLQQASTAQAEPAKMECPDCGVDRLKKTCPAVDMTKCPMIGQAASATDSEMVPHTFAGFRAVFQMQTGDQPNGQDAFNAGMRAGRDLEKREAESGQATPEGGHDERAAFEAWARDPVRSEKLPLDRWPGNDGYKDARTYIAFYGWKSGRAALAATKAAEPVGEVAHEQNWMTGLIHTYVKWAGEVPSKGTKLYRAAPPQQEATLPDWMKIEGDALLIHGVRYDQRLFKNLGKVLPVGEAFMIEAREVDGAITLCKLDKSVWQGSAAPQQSDTSGLPG